MPILQQRGAYPHSKSILALMVGSRQLITSTGRRRELRMVRSFYNNNNLNNGRPALTGIQRAKFSMGSAVAIGAATWCS
jgi:hypothetical protein